MLLFSIFKCLKNNQYPCKVFRVDRKPKMIDIEVFAFSLTVEFRAIESKKYFVLLIQIIQ